MSYNNVGGTEGGLAIPSAVHGSNFNDAFRFPRSPIRCLFDMVTYKKLALWNHTVYG